MTYYKFNKLVTKNCMKYAKYTIQDRAIPDINGLKPIHIRMLWSMYQDNLLWNKNRTKCANAVGSVMRYSPHGTSSIYQAMVRLTNDSVMLNLIDGKGAFSSCTTRDVNAGAERYTEARLSKLACSFFQNIEKNNIDMIDNYDNTRKEPKTLPIQFPLALCNPNIGIAVGISSSIPSFNINEVINNTINFINNKKMEIMYPDFSTYGYVIKDDDIANQIFNTGKGSFKLRAKYKIEENSIIITEIPYTTTREVIIEKITDLIKSGKIKDIIDINDFTGLNGLEINIETKKNVDKEQLMEKLYKMTTLEDTFNCNFTLLVDNYPQTLGIKEIISKWYDFRIDTIKREINFDIKQLEKNLHIIIGIEKIIYDIDNVISIIRSAETENEILTKLQNKYDLTKPQLEYIVKIKLINLNKKWLNEKISLKQDFINKLENLNNMLNSKELINNRIILELHSIKKEYGMERKTQIIEKSDIIIDEKEEIEDYSCFLTISKENYVKKLSKVTDIENIKTKDNDEIIKSYKTTNKSTLLIFTDKQNCYKLLLNDINKNIPSDLGTYIPSKIDLEKDEDVISIQLIEDYNGYLINIYKNNLLAKVPVKSFETKQKQSKLKNSLSKEKLIKQIIITEDIDLICLSTLNKILIVNTSEFNPKATRNSNGQVLMKQKDDSYIKNIILKDEEDLYKFENYDYYKGKRGQVGNYLKKDDIII